MSLSVADATYFWGCSGPVTSSRACCRSGPVPLSGYFPELNSDEQRNWEGRKDWCLWATGSFVPHSTGSLALNHIFPPQSEQRLGIGQSQGDEHSLPASGPSSSEITSTKRCMRNSSSWLWRMPKEGYRWVRLGWRLWCLRDGERVSLLDLLQNGDGKSTVYIFCTLF